jgi:hypothetical protein
LRGDDGWKICTNQKVICCFQPHHSLTYTTHPSTRQDTIKHEKSLFLFLKIVLTAAEMKEVRQEIRTLKLVEQIQMASNSNYNNSNKHKTQVRQRTYLYHRVTRGKPFFVRQAIHRPVQRRNNR